MRKCRWLACEFCDAFTHYECELKSGEPSALTGETYACPKCREGPKLPNVPKPVTSKVLKANQSAEKVKGRLLHARPFLRVAAQPGGRVVGQVGPESPIPPLKKRKLGIVLASAVTLQSMKRAKQVSSENTIAATESIENLPARVLAKQPLIGASSRSMPARLNARSLHKTHADVSESDEETLRKVGPLKLTPTKSRSTGIVIKPRSSKSSVPAIPKRVSQGPEGVITHTTPAGSRSIRPPRPRAPKELAKAMAHEVQRPRASGSRPRPSGPRSRGPPVEPRRRPRSLVDSIGSLHAKFPIDMYETLYAPGSSTKHEEVPSGYRARIEASLLQRRAKSPKSLAGTSRRQEPLARLRDVSDHGPVGELKGLATAIVQSLDPNFDAHTIYINVCRLIHKLTLMRSYVTKEMICEANLHNVIGNLLTSDDVRIRLAADSLLNIPAWREAICGNGQPQRYMQGFVPHAVSSPPILPAPTHLVGKPIGLRAVHTQAQASGEPLPEITGTAAATTPAQPVPANPMLTDYFHLGNSPEEAPSDDADFLFHSVGEPHLRGDRRVG